MVGDIAGLIGSIAGLVAAVGFVFLIGYIAGLLVKIGRVFDEARSSLHEATNHAVPILDEAAQTLASTNTQLERIDTMTTSAAQVSENLSALSSLYAATLGRPLIKIASFSYAARQAFSAASAAGRDAGKHA